MSGINNDIVICRWHNAADPSSGFVPIAVLGGGNGCGSSGNYCQNNTCGIVSQTESQTTDWWNCYGGKRSCYGTGSVNIENSKSAANRWRISTPVYCKRGIGDVDILSRIYGIISDTAISAIDFAVVLYYSHV